MSEFARVLSMADLPAGEMRIVVLDGEEVVVAECSAARSARSATFATHDGWPVGGRASSTADVVTCRLALHPFQTTRTGEVIDGVDGRADPRSMTSRSTAASIRA